MAGDVLSEKKIVVSDNTWVTSVSNMYANLRFLMAMLSFYGGLSFARHSIFLQTAVGFVGHGHFNQSGLDHWFHDLIPELGAVRPSSTLHKFQ